MSFCIMTPVIGNSNETYVRRHANDLVPGNTVVIALHEVPPERRAWVAAGPKLILPATCQIHGRAVPEHSVAAAISDFWKVHNVKAVLAEYLQFAVQYANLARSLGIPFYAHAHGLDCSALLRQEAWRTKYLELRGASGLIVVSNKMRAALTSLGIPDDLIHRIPCGVDAQEYIQRPDRGSKTRFLAVSRFTGKKGPIFLLNSFRQALQNNPDIELHIVGDGELLEAVIQFIDTFSLQRSVKLYGVQPHSAVK